MFDNLLSLAIWVPIAAGVLVLATGSDSRAGIARVLAFIGALAGFLVTLPLFTQFDRLNGGYQFTEFHSWIPVLNINYALGVDGISVLLVILNSFITLMVVLAGWQVIQKRPAQYMAAFLIMSGQRAAKRKVCFHYPIPATHAVQQNIQQNVTKAQKCHIRVIPTRYACHTITDAVKIYQTNGESRHGKSSRAGGGR